MYPFLLRRLPAILLGAAGAASIAYTVWRRRAPATFTRTLTLDSLRGDLKNWLPKLPFMPFIRIEVPGTADWLLIRGDDAWVKIELPQTTPRQRHLGSGFRGICSRLGYPVQEVPDDDGGWSLRCTVPAENMAAAGVLEEVLRGLFGVGPASTLLAAVPSEA